MKLDEIIEVDPEKLGGTPVFRGTRVPIQNLFDYLKAGIAWKFFLITFLLWSANKHLPCWS